MAKQKLIWSVDSDFLLAAIYTQEKLYRLAWLLNDNLNMNFCRLDDIKIALQKNMDESEHHLYLFENELEEWSLTLLKNQGTGGLLLKVNPLPAVILKAEGELSAKMFNKIEKFAKQDESIQLFNKIDTEKIKDKERFIFNV
jgi:hypothetical protein